MTTPQARRFVVEGPVGRVSALRWDGPEGAAPVLLLHPVNTAAAVWADVAPSLARPAAAVDYRGHGSSDAGPPYLPADFAADALAVLDDLGWERVHLVGGSIGGAVAVEVAARIPDRVLSIGCFGATLRIGMSESDVASLLTGLRELGVDEMFRRHGPQVVGPRARPGSGEQLVELAGGRDLEVVTEIVWTTFSVADSRSVAATLPPRPALVAVGTHDPTCPPVMAEELAGFLGTDVASLDGIGHLPMLEAPLEVTELLTALHQRVDMG